MTHVRGRTLALLGTLVAALVCAAPAHAAYDRPATFGLGKDTDRTVVMSDGVKLKADVYFPTDRATGRRAAGTFPVLLQQTVYGKNLVQVAGNLGRENTGYLAPLGKVLDPLIGKATGDLADTDVPYLVGRGYIVVISDIRGTGQSGGVWALLQHKEAQDGVELVDWAAKLPGANGRVGLWGVSYMGMVSYATAAAAPKGAVDAIFPIVADNSLYRELFAQGGIPNVLFDYTIGLTAIPALTFLNPALGPLLQLGLNKNMRAFTEGLRTFVPTVATHQKTFGSFIAPLVNGANLNRETAYDQDFWQSRSAIGQLRRIVENDIPVYAVGAWKDLFQRGALMNYSGLQNLAAGRSVDAPMLPGQAASPRYQLLMGPWTHTTMSVKAIQPVMLEWFDNHLKGIATPMVSEPNPLHLIQMHAGDRWHDAKTWPLRGGEATKLYLDPARTLTATAPARTTGSERLDWTPVSSPCSLQTNQFWAGTPELLSNLLLGGKPIPCLGTGSTDDSDFAKNGLRYTSEPFAEDQVLAGPINASLQVSLSALPLTDPNDMELVATVQMLSPDGRRSQPLTSGALLGSHRALDPQRTWYADNGEPLQPYHPYTKAAQQRVPKAPSGRPGPAGRYDVEVNPIFARIPAGWRLRLTITSAVTPNLLPSLAQMPTLVGGIYHVQTNGATPSFLNAPLFPAREFALRP
ncbi:MAG: CocE/NonD family hydrolase [Solirubrobacteraceae bacterium]|nr:CocE/NonD family hydrolase [Solirubrobacteraceae bacterium]